MDRDMASQQDGSTVQALARYEPGSRHTYMRANGHVAPLKPRCAIPLGVHHIGINEKGLQEGAREGM
eukprot:55400-Chlamydomonas_euryale.AAC.5